MHAVHFPHPHVPPHIHMMLSVLLFAVGGLMFMLSLTIAPPVMWLMILSVGVCTVAWAWMTHTHVLKP